MGSRGKLRWNNSEVRHLRHRIKINDFQRKVLIGLILGDGCLTKNVSDKNFRLQVEQSAKRKNYLFWLFDIFASWSLSTPRYINAHNSWRFRTITHPEVTSLRVLFYPKGVKIVPTGIDKFLISTLSLAIWFMDDGNGRKDARAYSISTHSFSKRENELLINCLKKNFNLRANLNWDAKGNRIYIPTTEAKRFESLVLPFILPSMRYKFPLTP